MKRMITTILVVVQVSFCLAQKKQLDTAAISKWQYVEGGKISNDGKWASYQVITGNRDKSETIIKSTDGKSILRLNGHLDVTFSADNRYAVYKQPENKLCFLRLGDRSARIISDVDAFQMLRTKVGDYILYTKVSSPTQLYSLSSKDGTEKKYQNIQSFQLADQSILMILKNANKTYELHQVFPSTAVDQLIYTATNAPDWVVASSDANKILFKIQNKLWLYSKIHIPKLLELPTDNELTWDNIHFNSFIPGGILFSYNEELIPERVKEMDDVKVYSYQDATFGMSETFDSKEVWMFYDLTDQKFTPLLDNGERLKSCSSNGKFAFISQGGNGGESYWNVKQNKDNCKIKKISTGELMSPAFNVVFENDHVWSSDSYLVYQNDFGGDILSADPEAGSAINLTKDLPIPLIDNVHQTRQGESSRLLQIIRMPQRENSVLAYDRYDIWQLDASGKNKPICLTGGFGRANHLIMRLVDETILMKGNTMFLKVFNEVNKDAGFYKVNWKDFSKPEKISMGAISYCQYNVGGPGLSLAKIQKAGNANVWLILMQSATSAPNYFLTSDFKKFHPVSDVHPEKEYQWFTRELINFTTKAGLKSQAILYKPDNLDTSKKYPVLFNYYEISSQNINIFHKPGYLHEEEGGFEFNFPLMLAKNYLICVPDINFKLGESAQSIVSSIEAAADEISKLAYVDSTRFGASGGSFGGYATNCLAAFSKKFKALVPISSLSDLISEYSAGMEITENRQVRMGVSFATDPELYLKNSPLTYVKNISTPLLIVHGAKDGNCKPHQAIQLFNSMRREGKKAWMVWYPEDDHGIRQGNNPKDLYVRMSQFFDHYLKGAPTPNWMMDTLPVYERSGEEGFELMPPGVEPGPGLNTEEDIQRRAEYLKYKSIH